MPASRSALAAWHFSPGAINRLLPPWKDVQIEQNEPLRDGSRTVLGLKVGPMRIRWVAVHEQVKPGEQFVDRSVQGPFKQWVHEHSFLDKGALQSDLRDSVEYQLRFSAISDIFMGWKIRSDLAQMFAFRHQRTRDDLARHSQYSDRPRRTIAVTGSTGAVGRALCAFLSTGGHRVLRLVRGGSTHGPDEVRWNPTGEWDASKLEGIDAVVHLAGANIAEGRWTAARKKVILESRELGTRNLSDAIARLNRPPSVMVCASGVGFYGNLQEGLVDESAPNGSGFLAQVTQAWESALQPVESRGIRVVRMRIGIVLNARTGVLGSMRLPFLFGAGGRVGSGRQGMSWIHLDDLVAAIQFAIEEKTILGAVNAVSPRPVAQIDFARALARVLHRPCIAPLPAPIVRLMFGEMGSELLLSGQFVHPKVLLEHGFRFGYATIDDALSFAFGKMK